MQNISLNFYDGKKLEIPYSSLNRIAVGGQSVVFRFKHDNKDYLLKAMPDEDSIFRRMSQLRNQLTEDNSIPDGLKFRSIPIGQGTASGEVFSFSTVKYVYLLVFNWVEGSPMDKALENVPALNAKRKKLTRNILDLLVYLQKKHVIHSDLYPDNFLISKNDEIFLIDLEGAGIMQRSNWIWHPLTVGKPYWFPKPLELEAEDSGMPDKFTDRWVGMFLIFWMLNGFKPFPFLQRIDHQALKALVDASDKDTLSWPPRILNHQKIEPFLNKDYMIEQFQKYMVQFEGTTFGRLLNMTYIHGYDQPKKRVGFDMIKSALEKFL